MSGTPAAGRRLLVLAPFPPRKDAVHGGARAIAHLMGELVERHEIVLLCLRGRFEPPVDEVLASRLVHLSEIRYGSGRGSRRISTLLGDYRELLAGTPSWVRSARSSEFGMRVREMAMDWKPEIVQLEYPVMGQYVGALRDSKARRLLVEHDFAVAAASEASARRRGPAKLRARLELVAWERFERALLGQLDGVVVFTESDAARMREFDARTPVRVIPLAAEVPSEPLDSAGAWPPTLLFIGSFVHEPNVDAAVRLARSIFPLIRGRFPELSLELVGHAPPAEVRVLARPGVRVHPDVPDVIPHLERASVVLAPLRFGGGMRIKVLEALAVGKAVVASPRALEGIDVLAGRHVLVAETDDEFGAAVADLLGDRARRVALGQAAYAWARDNLSWDRSAERLEHVYDALTSRDRESGTT